MEKSFREAYKEVGLNIEKLGQLDPVKINNSRVSAGTAGALNIDHITSEIDKLKKEYAKKEEVLELAVKELYGSKLSLS